MLADFLNNYSWLSGFLAGVCATTIGFIFTALWDIYKWRRDKKNLLQAMLSLALDELKNNIRIVNRNNALLLQELKILFHNKCNINPLTHLQTGAWDLMKYHFLDFLIKNSLISFLNSASHLVEEINEVVRSRELYRLSNEAMINFPEKMTRYDTLLTEQNDKLLKVLADIEAKTAKFIEVKKRM